MLAPLAPTDWSIDCAAHLLNRAGFGGTPEQINDFHQLGLHAAVEALLVGNGAQLPPPAWTSAPPTARTQMMMSMSGGMSDLQRKEAFKEAMQEERRNLMGLRSWWLERMREDRQPLLEKMTLFWHGHFATSAVKVKSAWFMWRQNETLRSYALGSFHEMFRAMTRDPAMIRWLDLGRSTRFAPNENFARESMELFTLGEGHYTEDDVKAGARAFTGHRIDPETQEFVFARQAHDEGEKHFLGRTGNFNADDLADIILAQDQCSRFVTNRIWEYLAYEKPEPVVLESAAAVFRSNHYEVKPLLRSIFQSSAFYSPRAMRTQIKSPVDWLVKACIALGTPLPGQPALDFILTRLGQVPFEPPNVRGWEGGKSWISSSTLVLRYNLAAYLVGAHDPATQNLFRQSIRAPADIGNLAPEEMRDQPAALADAMVAGLFGTSHISRMQDRAREAIALTPIPVSDDDARTICQKLMSTPDFQLT